MAFYFTEIEVFGVVLDSHKLFTDKAILNYNLTINLPFNWLMLDSSRITLDSLFFFVSIGLSSFSTNDVLLYSKVEI